MLGVMDNLAESAMEEAERRTLYAKDPNCAKCRQPINDVEEAFIVRRASGETVLIHWVDVCFSREVQDMLDRYVTDRKPAFSPAVARTAS